MVKLNYFAKKPKIFTVLNMNLIATKLHIIQTNVRSNSNRISVITNIESSCHEIQLNTIFID